MRISDPRQEKAIRDQALTMIVRDGFDGLSMHKLAQTARLSAATIDIYSQNREDLILKPDDKTMELTLSLVMKALKP